MATESHHSQVEAYLATYNILVKQPNMPPEATKQVLENLVAPIVDGVKSVSAYPGTLGRWSHSDC